MTLIKIGRMAVKNLAVKIRSFKNHHQQYSIFFIKMLLKERDQTGKPKYLP